MAFCWRQQNAIDPAYVIIPNEKLRNQLLPE